MATCSSFAQEWIEDPSNRNTQFDRVRVRNSLSRLQSVVGDGMDDAQAQSSTSAAIFAAAAERARLYAQDLDRFVRAQLRSMCVLVRPLGYVILDVKQLLAHPHAVRTMILHRICSVVSGNVVFAAAAEVESVCHRLSAPRTSILLGRCTLSPVSDDAASSSSSSHVIVHYECRPERPPSTSSDLPNSLLPVKQWNLRAAAASQVASVIWNGRFILRFWLNDRPSISSDDTASALSLTALPSTYRTNYLSARASQSADSAKSSKSLIPHWITRTNLPVISDSAGTILFSPLFSAAHPHLKQPQHALVRAVTADFIPGNVASLLWIPASVV